MIKDLMKTHGKKKYKHKKRIINTTDLIIKKIHMHIIQDITSIQKNRNKEQKKKINKVRILENEFTKTKKQTGQHHKKQKDQTQKPKNNSKRDQDNIESKEEHLIRKRKKITDQNNTNMKKQKTKERKKKRKKIPEKTNKKDHNTVITDKENNKEKDKTTDGKQKRRKIITQTQTTSKDALNKPTKHIPILTSQGTVTTQNKPTKVRYINNPHPP